MQMDVAANGAVEAVVARLRAVLSAAVAGAGVAGGLNRQLCEAEVALPLVASEAQVQRACAGNEVHVGNFASSMSNHLPAYPRWPLGNPEAAWRVRGTAN